MEREMRICQITDKYSNVFGTLRISNNKERQLKQNCLQGDKIGKDG